MIGVPHECAMPPRGANHRGLGQFLLRRNHLQKSTGGTARTHRAVVAFAFVGLSLRACIDRISVVANATGTGPDGLTARGVRAASTRTQPPVAVVAGWTLVVTGLAAGYRLGRRVHER